MTDFLTRPCTAFAGNARIANGPVIEVALALKARDDVDEVPVLVFDDRNGAQIDFDLSGSEEDIVARLEARSDAQGEATAPTQKRGRGRPKLGVTGREVTLLPRHWAWLDAQPGGASAALRRLVDEARKKDAGASDRRAAREAGYRFMMAIAGDLPGFEEATRALFAGDRAKFERETASWPGDIQKYALALAFGEDEGAHSRS